MQFTNLFHLQLTAKVSKLKGKLQNFENVLQLNSGLQSELLKLKEHKCNGGSSSNSSGIDPDSLKGLKAKIATKRAETEVSISKNSCKFSIEMQYLSAYA